MYILGLSCWYHDAAACLIHDGRLVAAAQEERFSRKKHDAEFPHQAIQFCLDQAGITREELDVVAFYDKPFLKFERLLETYVAYAPRGLRSFIKAMPLWLKQKLWIPEFLQKTLEFDGPLLFTEHHESHAASAFFPSPFEDAAILTTDGVGEWATTSLGIGEANQIRILSEIHFPHSLGLLYSAFTYFCGFKVNSGEYKLMGLAPYGEARYASLIREELIDLKSDGYFRLNMDYFTYPAGLTMSGRKLERLLGGARRTPESPLTQREMDLARSVQIVIEEAMLNMAVHAQEVTGKTNLCLAGGVALNCVSNGRLLREGPFDRIWIQPAAGDAGGAVGAAFMALHEYQQQQRTPSSPDAMSGAYLGPAYSNAAITEFLDSRGVSYSQLDEASLFDQVAEYLDQGKVIGWFQGRMEYGPRALGNRSILADPRGKDVQRLVNLKIKFRESFRPFAPSVLQEKSSAFFELDTPSPYMLLVAPVRNTHIDGAGLERLQQISSPIPAVTHVDGSARIQTVSKDVNPKYWGLLSAFERLTGCPVLVNTSFNVRGEPIVCTPQDAYNCFCRTHMDVLVLGEVLLTRDMLPGEHQRPFSSEEIAATYGLD